MKKIICAITLLTILLNKANAQQCNSGGCANFVSEYPTQGAPYTATTSWQVLINPATNNPALINAGNWTLFSVTCGNTYDWTYCGTYGGSEGWDAQLTLYNYSTNALLCFQDNSGLSACPNAPYLRWTATFTGTVQLLTSVVSCNSNSGSPYSELAYRIFTTGSCSSCTTPGTPSSATGTSTGQTTANLSWTVGSPAGSPTVTYYWVVGTNSSVTYGSGVAQSSTTGTSASTSALACNTTYYLRVYAQTSCNGSSSGYVTSSSFTTSSCTANSIYGVDISSGNGTISWPSVYAAGKTFAFVKATEGFTFNDPNFSANMTSPNSGSNKVILGAYHFARPDNQSTIPAGADSEATHYYNIAGLYLNVGYLPPALDMDAAPADSYLASHTTLQLAQWINEWAAQIYNATNPHRWPVLYMDRCRANYVVPYYGGTINSNIKLWIADYPETAGMPQSYTGCGPDWITWPWIFHQYFAPQNAGNDPTTYADPGMDQDFFNGDNTAFNNLIGGTITTTTITNFTISPSTVCPCDSFTITYTINASTLTTIMLGASIMPTGTSNYISDSLHDVKLTVPAGTSTQTRWFIVPCGTTQGIYDIITAIWQDTNGDGKIDAGDTPLSSTQNNGVLSVSGSSPQPVSASGSGTFCSSATLTANGGSGGTIYWQNTTSGGTSTATPSTSQVVTSSGTYYFRAYNSCGWGTEGSATVTINNVPLAVSASGSGTFCSSATLTANGGSGGTIYWQNTTSGGTSTATPSTSQVVTSSGTYYFRAYNSCGWGTEGSATVTINNVPLAVSASGSGTFCSSATLTANGGSGGTIYWQNTTSGGTSTATPSTSQVVTSSGTYYFRAYNSCGWGTEGSATVTINNVPLAVSASGSGTFCSSATLTANGGSGGTIYWQNTTSGGTSTATPSTSQVVTSSGTYYFRAYNSCGWGTEGSATVTINNVPLAVSASGSGTFCSSATLTANGGSGGTIYWQNTTSGGTSTATPSTSQVVTSSGTYYFRAYNSCGWGTEGSATVTINNVPLAVSASGSGTFCSSATLTANGGSGGTIYWQNTTSGGTSTATPSTSQVVTSSGTYYFRAYNSCGWGTEGSATVTINNVPLAVSASGSGTFCSSATLTANGGSGGTIYWQNTTSGGTSTATPSTSQVVTSSGTYYFRAYNSCGWGTEGSATVTINSLPDTSVRINGDTISANLSGASYQWIDCINGPITGATNQSYKVTQSGNYRVLITNNGCTDTSACHYVVMTGISEIISSDVFSIHPNPASGKITLTINKAMTNISLIIYNSIGEKVFEDKITSNGNYNQDIELKEAEGVYFVQLNDGVKIYSQRLIIQ